MSALRAGPSVLVVVIAAAGGIGTSAHGQAPPLWAPVPQSRPDTAPPSAPPVPSTPSASPATTGPHAAATSACQARLALAGVRFSPVAPPDPRADCAIDDPVRLDGMATDGGDVRWPDRPVVSCAFADTLADFTRSVAAPLARATAGQALVAFGTGPGFACRPRNRVEGGKMSAHGRGLAIDISWFDVGGGRRESVAAPGDATLARYVQTLRRAACGWFTTVLGPGSDAAHADHLHFDLERRGQRGDSRLCQ